MLKSQSINYSSAHLINGLTVPAVKLGPHIELDGFHDFDKYWTFLKGRPPSGQQPVGEDLEYLVLGPDSPAVLVLDDPRPHGQDVPAAVHGRYAAVLFEDVGEEIFVNRGESHDSQRSGDGLVGKEMSPEEVHHIPVHLRADHLELDPLLLERGSSTRLCRHPQS